MNLPYPYMKVKNFLISKGYPHNFTIQLTSELMEEVKRAKLEKELAAFCA